MPIIKSAKKRVKVAAKAQARNQRTKRQLRDSLKNYAKALETGKAAEINKAQAAAYQALDIAAKKAVIHRNKAARFKSKLAKQANAKGIKPTAYGPKPKVKATKTASGVKKPSSKSKT